MNNTWHWVLWVALSISLILLTRNPIFLLIIILMLFLGGIKLARLKQAPNWGVQNLRFLGSMLMISTLINVLFTHTGQTVLLSLPNNWPLIGGPLTLESMVYGALNGLLVGALYLTFNIFNLALTTRQMTSLIPRAFQPIAMMVTIALTFFPAIQQRTREIREAQLIRGNPMAKAADWLPILLPLLVSSLEDAFLLSESMASRGAHTQLPRKTQQWGLIGLLLSLFFLISGWILNLYEYPRLVSAAFYAIAGLTLTGALVWSGGQTKVTRFRRETWGAAEIATLILLLCASTGVLLAYLFTNPVLWSFSPYPKLGWPPCPVWGLLLSLCPAFPLAVLRSDD